MVQGNVVMVDTIHADTHEVPPGVADVGGYISGTSDIDWTSGDWAEFPNSKKFRIWQGFTPYQGVDSFDVIDVESGAVTPQSAADTVAARVFAGIPWTTIYGTDSTLAECSRLIQAKGQAVWNGHVNAWLANWNLSLQQAQSLLETSIHGMTCVAVQWASPSSNPHTVMPGSNLTLAQSNCDLSAALVFWTPSGGWDPPSPTPAPVSTYTGILVTHGAGDTLLSRAVTSIDNVNWQ